MNVKFLEQRAEILYETVSDIIDGRLDVGHPTSSDYIDALIYSYAIQHRSISRIYRTFKNQRPFLEIDSGSVEAVLEDITGVYGVYIPGGDRLLDDEFEIIEELNDEMKKYLH